MPDGTSTPWRREGRGPWYWRATLYFLTQLPDRRETMSSLFRRHEHSSLGGNRNALDQLSWLIEHGDIPADATVSEAIAGLKQLHRRRMTGDRGWQ